MALHELPRVDQLNLASLELPDTHPAARLGRTVPVHGFLIHHPDGAILVDTGVGFGNDFIDELYRPSCTALDAALASCEVAVADVVAVVNSHLHFDHCGQNPVLFGGSTSFYSQDIELGAVTADDYYTDRRWALCPRSQQRVVNGDEEIAEGVTILSTPGHTAGHQSVLVQARDERVVVGGQLVWHGDELEAEVASAANVDDIAELKQAAVDSIRRIKSLHPSIGGAPHEWVVPQGSV
ncbi:MAG: MBL fold metallo-hydrolase [Actinobacteria bacterium]|nr:MBL fold metallo-hydrolase [Actinomycetota bacterium]